jgi:hypothetical protein
MAAVIGIGVTEADALAVQGRSLHSGVPGEQVLAVVASKNWKPALNYLAITSHRVAGYAGANPDPVLGTVFTHDELTKLDFQSDRMTVIASRGSMTFKFRRDDASIVQKAMEEAKSRATWQELGTDRAGPQDSGDRRKMLAAASIWPNTEILGFRLEQKPSLAVEELCRGEDPWLIVNTVTAGLLAAWTDRAAIVKTGFMTGLLSGASGGGRMATFYFRDITGIEYNSGFSKGVLEILTPSYQGTQTNDYWGAGRNDPFKLSNALPLTKSEYQQAKEGLDELRTRIEQQKQQQQASVMPNASLADELQKLAALRDQGLLSEEEFGAAKMKLIS